MEDLCIVSESRGGMMAYMAARRDDRIKKMIIGSGVSDLFMSYEAREDMRDLLVNCIGGTPEEKDEEYKKRSAVYWADEINIPTLIIHSKKDEYVPFEQAEKMYNKLKDNVECKFITHDDDYHGIPPEDLPEIMKWLNK